MKKTDLLLFLLLLLELLTNAFDLINEKKLTHRVTELEERCTKLEAVKLKPTLG